MTDPYTKLNPPTGRRSVWRTLLILAAALLVGTALESPARGGEPRDTASDTWVITDGLGRELPSANDAAGRRTGRYVAMFYFIWHNASPRIGLFDVSKILAANPAAMDTTNSPPWGPLFAMHYWGEPLFGYSRCRGRG